MQTQEQIEKEFEQHQNIPHKCEQKAKNKIISQFYDIYRNQTDGYVLDRVQIQNKLSLHNIRYKPNQYKDFHFQIQQSLLNYFIIKVRVKVIHFQLQLYILNQAINNPLINNKQKVSGRFGNVYFMKYVDEKIAIKSVTFKSYKNFGIVFEKLLKQVSITKIYSILASSLMTQKYLGFDLIVYNDCIQFAMKKKEEGCKKQNKPLLAKLKSQLSLLHSLNIVHCDIKPQNIVFCPIQNKFMFIDFGLSQIIEEDYGFKSKTYFKGTPQFSSHEMASIMASQNQKYIDLYFNDYYGLKKSIEYKFQLNFDEYEEKKSISQSIQISENILSKYLTYVFKYYYIFNNVSKLNDILNYNDHFLTKRSNKELLVFINRIYHKIFIPEIFHKYFNCYQIIDQYKSIERLFKLSKETVFFQSIQISEKSLQSSQFFKRYLEIDINQKFSNKMPTNFEFIFAYFMKYNHINVKNRLNFDSKQVMYDLFLQCLRFDKINLKFDKKLKLSEIFKQLMGFPKQQNHKQSISDIKVIFKGIMDYLLQLQQTKWILQKRFDVFYQLIILQVDVNQQIFKYIPWVKTKCYKIQDRFILVLELINLCRLIYMKNITISTKYFETLHAFLLEYRFQLLSEIIQLMAENQLQIFICYLSKIMISNKDIRLEERHFQIVQKLMTNHRGKRFIKQISNDTKIISFLDNNPYLQTINKEIKSIMQQGYQNQNLLNLFTFTAQLLTNKCFYQQLKQLKISIRTMLDCQEIYQTFYFQFFSFVFNRQSKDEQQLSKCINYMLQNYQEIKVFSCLNFNIIIWIYYLLLKILDNPQFLQKHQQIVKQFYMKFIHSNYFWECSIYKIQAFNNFIQILFVSMLPNQLYRYFCLRLAYFRQKVLLAERNYIKDSSFQNMLSLQKVKLQLTMYLSFQAQVQNNKVQYLSHLIVLYQLTSQLYGELKALQKYSFSIIQLSLKSSKTQLVYYYINRIESVLAKNERMNFYFNPSQLYLITLIFQFHINTGSFNKIYQLLQELAEWIVNNPFEAYIAKFIDNMVFLLRRSKQIFTYPHLEQNIVKFRQKIIQNPYYAIYLLYSVYQEQFQTNKMKILKLISLKLDYLVRSAKRNILVFHYAFIINLKAIPLRKKMHLIKFTRNIEKERLKQLKWNEAFYFKKIINNNNKGIKKQFYKKLKYKLKYFFI